MNIRRQTFKLRTLLAAAAVAMFMPRMADAQEAGREFDVKAAFVYNFAQFIEWPDNTFQNESSPFVIGVLGNDSIAGALTKLIGSKKIGTHPVRVEAYRTVEEIRIVQVLYIATNDEIARAAIGRTSTMPVLTVGQTEKFLGCDGTIRLYAEDRKMRFEINLRVAERAGLKVSSKLLKLAKIYGN